MGISLRPGWGNIQSVIPTVTVAGGPLHTWTVASNVGIAVQVPVADIPVRLSYIHARIIFLTTAVGQIDYTPYRLMVIKGVLPADVSQLQAPDADLASTAQAELPGTRQGAGFDILEDWTYQNGLYAPSGIKLPDASTSVATNQISQRSSYLNGAKFEVHHEFGGGGPLVLPNDTLSVLWIPMTTFAVAPNVTPNGSYNVYFSLSAWGRDEPALSRNAMQFRALPRYDVDPNR